MNGEQLPEVPEILYAKHVFTVNPANDFVCLICNQPRAMHDNDGFSPCASKPLPDLFCKERWSEPGYL